MRRSTNQKRSKGKPGRFPGKLLGDQPARAPETAFCKSACDLLCLHSVSSAWVLLLLQGWGLPCSILGLFGVRGMVDLPASEHSTSRWALMEDKGLKRREKALKASPRWTYWERLFLLHLHKSTEENKLMLLCFCCSLDFRDDCCDISLLRSGQDRMSLYSFSFSSSWNILLQKNSAASHYSICCLEEAIHLQREQQTSQWLSPEESAADRAMSLAKLRLARTVLVAR